MLLGLALRNLDRNRRRMVSLLATIAIGTAAIFAFDGFNVGLMNQVRESMIHSFHGYGQIYTRGYVDQVLDKPWERWIERWPEVRAKLRSIPEVRRVFPRVQFFALLTNGRISIGGRGLGGLAAAEEKFFTRIRLVQGELLGDHADGIMLGKGLARSLGVKPGDRVGLLGTTVRGSINSLDLLVTGIFDAGTREFDNTLFRVQLGKAQELLDTDRVECAALDVGELSAWPAVERAVLRELPGLEALSFARLSKDYYQNSVDWLDAQFGVLRGIILVIVLLGIFNMLASSILERRSEIGNLRANGESFGDVLLLLGLEGLGLGILGSLLGLALALALNWLLDEGVLMPPAPGVTVQFRVKLALQPGAGLLTFLLGVATTSLASLLAAWRAARGGIAEALRAA